MFEAHVPAHFLPESMVTATYIMNCVPKKSLYFEIPLDTLQAILLVHGLIPCILEYLVVWYNRPSVSLWGALVLFVRKKDGSFGLCVGNRKLN